MLLYHYIEYEQLLHTNIQVWSIIFFSKTYKFKEKNYKYKILFYNFRPLNFWWIHALAWYWCKNVNKTSVLLFCLEYYIFEILSEATNVLVLQKLYWLFLRVCMNQYSYQKSATIFREVCGNILYMYISSINSYISMK